MMDFSLSDEQKMIIDTVRRFIKEELAPLEDEAEVRAAFRADAVKQGVWPPKGGPARMAKMSSTLRATVPFSPLK